MWMPRLLTRTTCTSRARCADLPRGGGLLWAPGGLYVHRAVRSVQNVTFISRPLTSLITVPWAPSQPASVRMCVAPCVQGRGGTGPSSDPRWGMWRVHLGLREGFAGRRSAPLPGEGGHVLQPPVGTCLWGGALLQGAPGPAWRWGPALAPSVCTQLDLLPSSLKLNGEPGPAGIYYSKHASAPAQGGRTALHVACEREDNCKVSWATRRVHAHLYTCVGALGVHTQVRAHECVHVLCACTCVRASVSVCELVLVGQYVRVRVYVCVHAYVSMCALWGQGREPTALSVTISDSGPRVVLSCRALGCDSLTLWPRPPVCLGD